jgi:hypothetical protein
VSRGKSKARAKSLERQFTRSMHHEETLKTPSMINITVNHLIRNHWRGKMGTNAPIPFSEEKKGSSRGSFEPLPPPPPPPPSFSSPCDFGPPPFPKPTAHMFRDMLWVMTVLETAESTARRRPGEALRSGPPAGRCQAAPPPVLSVSVTRLATNTFLHPSLRHRASRKLKNLLFTKTSP